MEVPSVISAAVLIGVLTLSGPALAQANKNDDPAKKAGAEKARSEQLQAISKAITDWDKYNRARLFRVRALAECGINCPPNSGQELVELDKGLQASVSTLLDDLRAIPVVSCDAAFAQRVQHLFDDKASDRKPLTVKLESKCSGDGTLLLSTMTTVDMRELKQAGAERAKNDQTYYMRRAVANWDRENAARLSRLKALADCGSNCPPNSGDELLKLDGALHDSVPKLLEQIRAVPLAACDTEFAQRVQQLFDAGASDRKPLTVKADAKCSSGGKLQLSTMTTIVTRTLHTSRSDKIP